MNNLRQFMCLGLLCLPGILTAQITDLDQQVIASSGDAASGGGVSLSWTIGEILTTTETGGGLILHQGFQQGLDDQSQFWPVSLDEAPLVTKLLIYPNPAETHLWIEAEEAAELDIRVYNSAGQLIHSAREQFVSGQRMNIPTIITWAEGSYFLSVTSPDRAGSKTMTILKH